MDRGRNRSERGHGQTDRRQSDEGPDAAGHHPVGDDRVRFAAGDHHADRVLQQTKAIVRVDHADPHDDHEHRKHFRRRWPRREPTKVTFTDDDNLSGLIRLRYSAWEV